MITTSISSFLRNVRSASICSASPKRGSMSEKALQTTRYGETVASGNGDTACCFLDRCQAALSCHHGHTYGAVDCESSRNANRIANEMPKAIKMSS